MKPDIPRIVFERVETGNYDSVGLDLGITGTDINQLRELDAARAKKIFRVPSVQNLFLVHASWRNAASLGRFAEAYLQRIATNKFRMLYGGDLAGIQEAALALPPGLEFWYQDELVPSQL